VQYGPLMREPIGEVRKLYAHFDEPLTPAAEAAMPASSAQPKGKHGRHDMRSKTMG